MGAGPSTRSALFCQAAETEQPAQSAGGAAARASGHGQDGGHGRIEVSSRQLIVDLDSDLVASAEVALRAVDGAGDGEGDGDDEGSPRRVRDSHEEVEVEVLADILADLRVDQGAAAAVAGSRAVVAAEGAVPRSRVVSFTPAEEQRSVWMSCSSSAAEIPPKASDHAAHEPKFGDTAVARRPSGVGAVGSLVAAAASLARHRAVIASEAPAVRSATSGSSSHRSATQALGQSSNRTTGVVTTGSEEIAQGVSIMEGVQRKMKQLDRFSTLTLNGDASESPTGRYDAPPSPVKFQTSRSNSLAPWRSPPEAKSQSQQRLAVSVAAVSVAFAVLVAGAFSLGAWLVMQAAVEEAGLDEETAELVLGAARRGGALAGGGLTVAAAALAGYLGGLHGRSLERLAESLKAMRVFEADQAQEAGEWAQLLPKSRIADVRRLQLAMDRLHSSIATFGCFLPETIVRSIVRGDDRAQRLHVERREVSIMFSDIKDFTNITEALRPKDLLLLLTRYLDVMSRIAHGLDGVVAEILGDGLLVFWNTPDEVEDHRPKAAAAALAQIRALRPLNIELEALRLPTLAVRIGLHTGKVLTGNIGSLSRMKFGCIGDPVNLCARLEGLCKLYDVSVICSGAMHADIKAHGFFCRKLDTVRVKGKTKPTDIYEVIGLDPALAAAEAAAAAAAAEAAGAGAGGAGGAGALAVGGAGGDRFSTDDICAVATEAFEASSKSMIRAMEGSTPLSALKRMGSKIKIRSPSHLRSSMEAPDAVVTGPSADDVAQAGRSFRCSATEWSLRTKRSCFSELTLGPSLRDSITEEVRHTTELYESALAEYQAGSFALAKERLEELLRSSTTVAGGVAAQDLGRRSGSHGGVGRERSRLGSEDSSATIASKELGRHSKSHGGVAGERSRLGSEDSSATIASKEPHGRGSTASLPSSAASPPSAPDDRRSPPPSSSLLLPPLGTAPFRPPPPPPGPRRSDGAALMLLERVKRYIGEDGQPVVKLSSEELRRWDGILDLDKK